MAFCTRRQYTSLLSDRCFFESMYVVICGAQHVEYIHTYILFRSKSTEMQEKQQALGELDGKVQRTLTTARQYKLRPTKIQSKTQNKNLYTV